MPASSHNTHSSACAGRSAPVQPGPPTIAGANRAARRAATAAPNAAEAGHLSVDAVAYSYPDRRVLSGISFTARPGDRIGLIGENGTGKSTLLRIIAGELPPDHGTVRLPGSVGLLAQELPYPGATAVQRVLDDAQAATRAVLAKIDRLGVALAASPSDETVANEFAAALEAAERSGAWAAEAQRGEVLAGLGLAGLSEQRRIDQLSGGQRLRLALAALLLAAPHTMLLDEPSNHLDDASAQYLERVLRDWPGIVILASHDRTLLDSVTTRILDLDPLPVPASELADARVPETAALTAGSASEAGGPAAPNTVGTPAAATTPETDDTGTGFGVRMWGVGYSAARAERRAELGRWRARYRAERAEIAALHHEIEVGSREVNRKQESKSESRISRKFYADKDARVTSRRARNARVRLDALERDRVRRPPEPLAFSGFTDHAQDVLAGADQQRTSPREVGVGGDPGHAMLSVTSVSVAQRLAPVSFELPAGGRLLLDGPNGSGKSALLAVIAGALAADTGSVVRRATLGYLPQEVTYANPDRSAAQHYHDVLGPDLAEALPLVGTGLLAPRDLNRPVGTLSVGQRRRLALATLVAAPPEILLLDEPSNHLSLTLVEELEQALDSFTGGLIIATHDRWLRSRWRGAVRRVSPV